MDKNRPQLIRRRVFPQLPPMAQSPEEVFAGLTLKGVGIAVLTSPVSVMSMGNRTLAPAQLGAPTPLAFKRTTISVGGSFFGAATSRATSRAASEPTPRREISVPVPFQCSFGNRVACEAIKSAPALSHPPTMFASLASELALRKRERPVTPMRLDCSLEQAVVDLDGAHSPTINRRPISPPCAPRRLLRVARRTSSSTWPMQLGMNNEDQQPILLPMDLTSTSEELSPIGSRMGYRIRAAASMSP
jgi:hypothetical protein